jgi:hypothetical protein
MADFLSNSLKMPTQLMTIKLNLFCIAFCRTKKQRTHLKAHISLIYLKN